MPQAVIDSAERTLRSLEKTGNVAPAKDEGLQLSFFQLDDPTLSSIRDSLQAADLNNMTPLQAFDLIRAMKKELGL